MSGYDGHLDGWLCQPKRHVNVTPRPAKGPSKPPKECDLSTCKSKRFIPFELTPPRRPT